MKKDAMVTVVTPTFNRGYILDKCYLSLKKQTNKSFIWIIIDDGSTDNTEKLVEKWMNEKHLNIEYYKKKNGGKASALNFSFDMLKTKYFVCLDSDDQLTPGAIEEAIKTLEPISKEPSYCGMLALRNHCNGGVMGGRRIPLNVTETTIMAITDKYRIRSEFIQFYKKEIINDYRFPEIKGEKFISPEYLAREINRKYKFKVSQEKLCICEYLADGLTKNKLEIIKKNPKGYTLVKKQSFDLAIGLVPKSKHAIMYIAGSILSNDKNAIKNSPNKLMTLLYYPLGYLAYLTRFKIRKY
ncbi:glycosyltransferase involved in cell wall biosynthesis [Natronobacillus azotifigens]|uniref:Glycosyltransferase family A protein n=1 Tax=Natronobacillus azotifigens TaxID=472978 RepID=A0A9J6RCC2_9BACI|nr:glycosyltransferase family A protein [Natronobacillus azotifigens]MCZ0702995.1 glycosyltransferase family A protein [Natronobacillus azotifigens]